MILNLNHSATVNDIQTLIERLAFMGMRAVLQHDTTRKSLMIVSGIDNTVQTALFTSFPQVESVVPLNSKYQLVGKHGKNTSILTIKDKIFGGETFHVMAGPCSIESEQQISAIAESVKQSGATVLRGGAFKPRTSPYDFQGLGEDGLRFMRQAATDNNLLSISEVMSAEDVPLVANYIDILQIGSRNMQNFALLKAVGQSQHPVMLKRGLCATYHEFLLAAEYILSEGNPNVMLCERGIRSFETYTRNILDLSAVPILKSLTHLPIIVDPSHGTGLRELVPTMARGALAVGADGVMMEVHTDPDQSISDARQTISTSTYNNCMVDLRRLASALDRTIA